MKFTFRRGIHPLHDAHEGKGESRGQAIRAFVPESVCIPMDMHIGAPSKPLVKKGDHVLLGQMIAEPVGGIGIPVHASVAGEVTEVAVKQMLGRSTCITIRNDGSDQWVELSAWGRGRAGPSSRRSRRQASAAWAGLLPPHQDVAAQGKPIDIIILNGAECETFLTDPPDAEKPSWWWTACALRCAR